MHDTAHLKELLDSGISGGSRTDFSLTYACYRTAMNLRTFLALGFAFLMLVQVLNQRNPGPPALHLAVLQSFGLFLQFLNNRLPLPTVYRRIVDEYGNQRYLGHDVYADWSRHPFEFMRCTGFTPGEFGRLLHDIEPQMPGHRVIDNRNCLLLTLWWLRCYPTLHLCSLVFDLHPSTVAVHLAHMREILHGQLSQEIQWPTNPEWQQLRY